MKTEWDYTSLAKAYLKRADYSDEAINTMLEMSGISESDNCCDVGAGVAHLTLKLAQKNINVDAVEPNDEMRKYGKIRTERYNNVKWFEGTGENTGRESNKYDIVTFGSSFNVTDRSQSLLESKRICKNRGWFAIMWNHRDLNDPIQSSIENIIKDNIPNYGYGSRREDQTQILENSNMFEKVYTQNGKIIDIQKIDDIVEAWKSHGTLHRQAGDNFEKIISSIEKLLLELNKDSIEVPYTTKIWYAQFS